MFRYSADLYEFINLFFILLMVARLLLIFQREDSIALWNIFLSIF